MMSQKLKTLLDFTASKYKGIETNTYDNNLLSEMHIFNTLNADMLLDDKYIVWIKEKELIRMISKKELTAKQIAQDLGFSIAYVALNEGEESAKSFCKDIVNVYYLPLQNHAPSFNITSKSFLKMVADNILQSVDVYA